MQHDVCVSLTFILRPTWLYLLKSVIFGKHFGWLNWVGFVFGFAFLSFSLKYFQLTLRWIIMLWCQPNQVLTRKWETCSREMSKYLKRGIKQKAVIFFIRRRIIKEKRFFLKISLTGNLDNLKRCADGKILMEEAVGSMVSSMFHLLQEFAYGQIQLPSLEKKNVEVTVQVS